MRTAISILCAALALSSCQSSLTPAQQAKVETAGLAALTAVTADLAANKKPRQAALDAAQAALASFATGAAAP